MTKRVLSEIRKTARGLFFPSEKDAPFRTISFPNAGEVNAHNITMLTQQSADRPVEEVSFDEFFEELTREQKWHGEDERAVLKKFRDLEKILRDKLSRLTIFKIGEVQKKVYILGQSAEGEWLGLETESLET